MSDSDENAFASADEGEENDGTPKPAAKNVAAKQEKKIEKASGAAAGASKDAKGPEKQASSAMQRDEAKRGKGKQQQKNRKGKTGGTAAQQKNENIRKQEPFKTSNEAEVESGPKMEETGGKTVTASPDKTMKPDSEDSSKRSNLDNSTKGMDAKGDKSAKDSSSADDARGEEVKEVPNVQGKNEEASSMLKSQSSGIKSPEAQSIPASERDHHTPQQEQVLHKLEESANSGGSGWGWSSWGSSLLSAASTSVQTFTSQVEGGLNTIMDTVESSLGVPDAKTLAEADSVQESKTTDAVQSKADDEKASKTSPKSEVSEGQEEDDQVGAEAGDQAKEAQATGSSGWFSSWGVGDLAKKMQDTGKSLAAKGQNLMTEGFDAVEHLAAGGIDVLETIGKKTYNTIAEHDPALKRTRQFLSPRSNKPNLSSVLREAREKAEQEQKQEEATQEALKAHFGTLFDDYQGIAHLEALEILSNQSEKKVHSLLNSLAQEDLGEIKPQLLSIKEAFEIDDDSADEAGEQDFTSQVSQHLSELKLGTAPDKLNKVHQMVQAWIQDFDGHDSNHTQTTKETHEKSIQVLAELTAKGVEQFHKAGEMVLLSKDKDKDCTERAHSLARLTGVLCHEIGNLSNKFVACLNKIAEEDKSEDVTSMITNIYLEASNSSTYIQDAFVLLLPVLQHAALEQAILARTS